MMLRLALPVVLLFVTGCASMIENPSRRAPVEEIGRPAPSTAPPEVGPPAPPAADAGALRREPLPPSGPPVLGPPAPEAPAEPTTATGSLLVSVQEAMAAGDLERAGALCERALRITPRDGQLWYTLATIRQRQGRTADARGHAQRALSLAAGNDQLERQSRVLLELLDLDEEQ